MNKIYQVIFEFDKTYDTNVRTFSEPYAVTFVSKEDAEKCMKYIEDYYENRCKVACRVYLNVINMDKLYTFEQQKEQFEEEYKDFWESEIKQIRNK